MRDFGNGYRQSSDLCARCYGNDPEYENDTDLFEVCPDCGEIWEQAPEYSIAQIAAFYENAWNVGRDILRSILNDRESYIKAKAENPEWSNVTLEMANFSNQAMTMLSICKHTFGVHHTILGPPYGIEAGQATPEASILPEFSIRWKVQIQEQHQACLTRWIESGWTDNDAKKRMFELMDVMLSWEGSN